MRGRMSDAPSYAEPVALGAVMVGATVSRVVASNMKNLPKVIGCWPIVAGKITPSVMALI